MIRSMLQDLTVRHKIVALTIAGLVILGLVIVSSSQPDLSKMEALYNRGQFQAARVGLAQALQKEPEWHEARFLLAQTELSDGRQVAALEQMGILAEAGWDITEFEVRLNRWLASDPPDLETAKQIVDFSVQAMEQIPQWDWLREFGLKVAVDWALEELPGYLSHLGERDFDNYWSLVEQGWFSAVESGAWETAWQVSGAIDKTYERYNASGYPGLEFRVRLVASMGHLEVIWAELQAKFPEDCLVAVARAISMPRDQGLDWLVEWEGHNQVAPEAVAFYSTMKGRRLILGVEKLKTIHLANIESEDLLSIALNMVDDEVKFMLLLDYLAQDPEMVQQVEIAKLILEVPEPEWQIDAAWGVSASEDGSKVMLHQYGEQPFLFNLSSGDEVTFPASFSDYFLSPDGSKVAVMQDSGWGYSILTYSGQGEMIQELGIDSRMSLIGWRDSNSLWLSALGVDYGFSLCVLDLSDGTISKLDIDLHRQTWFQPGPGGRIAWFRDKEVGLWDGDSVSVYSYGDSVNALAWSLDGTSLIVTIDSELHIQNIGGNLVALDLPRGRIPLYFELFLSWRSRDELYFNYSISNRQTMLAIYNVRTGKTTMTGILNPSMVVGNRVLAHGNDGRLLIYNLH